MNGKIILPAPIEMSMTVSEAMRRRRSIRETGSGEIPDDILATLLWAVAGITGDDGVKRTVPSTMALHAVKAYVLRADGAWAYDARENALVRVADGDCRSSTTSFQMEFVMGAPVTLVFTAPKNAVPATWGAMTFEVPPVSFLCDAGTMAQNAYLCAAALGLHGCARAAFIHEPVSRAMDLPADEEPVLLFTVGMP